MHIETLRFGAIEIPEEAVLTFPQGLLGFVEARRFCLLPYAPSHVLRWLQSVEDPMLAFLTVEPHQFFPSYEIVLSEADMRYLELDRPEEAAVLALLTISRDREAVTADLAGPIVINIRNRRGRQILVDDPRYATKHLVARLGRTLAEGAK